MLKRGAVPIMVAIWRRSTTTRKLLMHLHFVVKIVGLVQAAMTMLARIGYGTTAAAGHIPIGTAENRIMWMKNVSSCKALDTGMMVVALPIGGHYVAMKVLHVTLKLYHYCHRSSSVGAKLKILNFN